MHQLATVIARRRRSAHTTILAQRRGPSPIVLVPLAVGFALAVVVDRALGEPSSAPVVAAFCACHDAIRTAECQARSAVRCSGSWRACCTKVPKPSVLVTQRESLAES